MLFTYDGTQLVGSHSYCPITLNNNPIPPTTGFNRRSVDGLLQSGHFVRDGKQPSNRNVLFKLESSQDDGNVEYTNAESLKETNRQRVH